MLHNEFKVARRLFELRVSFKLFGLLRSILEKRVVGLDIPDNSTVRVAVDKLVEIGGIQLGAIILNGDHVSGNLIVLLNQKDIDILDGEDTLVNDGDEIILLPHVQGG